MRITANAAATQTEGVDLIGIIAFEEDVAPKQPARLPPLDPGLTARLTAAISEERFKAQPGKILILALPESSRARRLAVIGAGPRAAASPADLRHPAAVLARLAGTVGATSVLVLPTQLPAAPPDMPEPAAALEAIAVGLALGSYRFDKYLAAERRLPHTLERATVQLPAEVALVQPDAAIARGLRVAAAVAAARDLVNEPAGTLTPTELADRATQRASECGLSATILGPLECRQQGMGLFLAVAQGSEQEPRFIHLAWKPAGAAKRVVVIGKGVTFDSGGLSLKTNEGMQDMKSDMAGAAAVLSAIAVAAEERLPVEVHALAACTENMPSGRAYKLGDVLRSMAGKTVEINNTDAEGRLTLADALTYARALAPDVVLDFATLTGACVVALGPHTAGVMTNDEPTRAAWLAAARAAGEDMWPLPLPPRLSDQLRSEIADMRNTGERWGGALTAGLFLREFAGETPWVHVDIAGPATTDKEWGCFGKGATGFAVASIVQYLRVVAGTGPTPTAPGL
jgi:leucyl aminopeptidase